MGCGGNRNDVVQVVVGRVVGRCVVIAARIARRCDKQGLGRSGGRDGIVERLRISAAAPTVVGHPDSHHGGIVDRQDRVHGRAGAAVAEELEGHQLGIPVNAHDALAVIAARGDRARHMGAVGVAVVRIAVPVGEVVAVDIVDVAVAVVIQAVAGNLARIDPHVIDQVRMGVIDSGVDDAHHDIVAGLNVPGLGRVDIGIGYTARLAGIIQPPETSETGVARNGGVECDRVVRLDVLKTGIIAPVANHILNVSVDRPEFKPKALGTLKCRTSQARLHAAEVAENARAVRLVAELDDQLLLGVFGIDEDLWSRKLVHLSERGRGAANRVRIGLYPARLENFADGVAAGLQIAKGVKTVLIGDRREFTRIERPALVRVDIDRPAGKRRFGGIPETIAIGVVPLVAGNAAGIVVFLVVMDRLVNSLAHRKITSVTRGKSNRLSLHFEF